MTARGLRSFGFGFSAVLIGIHLERRGLSPALIGLALGLGLAAASLAGLAAVPTAARFGRRRTLALVGLGMGLTGLDLAVATQPALLVIAGATGMLGAASSDLGPFAPLEQSALTDVVPPARRNLAFGRYSLTGGMFNAAGGLSAAAATAASISAFYLLYAALGVATAILPLLMTSVVEVGVPSGLGGPLRDRSLVRVLAGLAALFALDSLAGGFVTNAVIAYWFHARFGVGPALLGPLFAAVAVLQSVSYEISARLSVRIGLINTMVFTHLPSNVLLILVALAPTLGAAIALVLARFLLSQMDVPARQAYIVSIVPAPQRAAALALVGAVRGVAMAFGPPVAGVAIGAAAFGVPFYLGGGLKIVYDLALFAGFRRRRAQHET
ncbi:MAG TPA: MFS transporter [Candidatus Udaeobacter sp.]|nr:MFS transporter [Candidatus Udaeobacter sp.]